MAEAINAAGTAPTAENQHGRGQGKTLRNYLLRAYDPRCHVIQAIGEDGKASHADQLRHPPGGDRSRPGHPEPRPVRPVVRAVANRRGTAVHEQRPWDGHRGSGGPTARTFRPGTSACAWHAAGRRGCGLRPRRLCSPTLRCTAPPGTSPSTWIRGDPYDRRRVADWHDAEPRNTVTTQMNLVNTAANPDHSGEALPNIGTT